MDTVSRNNNSSDVDMHTVYTAFPRILTLSLTTTGRERTDFLANLFQRLCGQGQLPWAHLSSRSALTRGSQKSHVVIVSSCHLQTAFCSWCLLGNTKDKGQTVFIRNTVTVVTLFSPFALHSFLWLRLVKKLEQSWNRMCSDLRVELTPDS